MFTPQKCSAEEQIRALEKPARLSALTYRLLTKLFLIAVAISMLATILVVPVTPVAAQTPVAVQFNPVDNYGNTQILVDGLNLLLVNGFHIIGSKAGPDTQNNINSESPYNTAGVMHSQSASGGSLPFSLKFNTDPHDASKLYFTANVGPSSDTFAALSIPLECKMQYFNYWRSSNSSVVNRYDYNRLSYQLDIGKYYIEQAPGIPQWGEIIGPKYTIRVTITGSSRPMPLFFVNAPNLATGDRDVEFAIGAMQAGLHESVSGVIQAFRTDPLIIPAIVYESELSQYHQIGRKDADGWSVNVKDTPKSFLQYGPYADVADWGGVNKGASIVPAGSHIAVFRLLLDNVQADNNRILTIDVRDATTGQTLNQMDITRKMFDTAFQYKEFTLGFDASPGHKLEFRTFWWGSSYCRQDSVLVR